MKKMVLELLSSTFGVYTASGLAGGLAGAVKSVWSYWGLLKHKDMKIADNFSWKMFSVTLIQGVIAGIVLGTVSPSPDTAFVSTLGINAVFDANKAPIIKEMVE